MFGHSNSSLLRMKPPASNWLLAPMPLPRNSHSAPIAGWFLLERRVQRHRLQTLELQVHLQVVLRVLAYAGQLLHQRDAELLQQRARADPERCRICGEAMAPPQHFAARARVGLLAAAQITNADGTRPRTARGR